MPRFLDHHPLPGPVNPAQVLHGSWAQRLKGEIHSGQAAEFRARFGIKVVNAFVSKNEMYCLLEAPDAASVVKFHEATSQSLRENDVVEVLPLI